MVTGIFAILSASLTILGSFYIFSRQRLAEIEKEEREAVRRAELDLREQAIPIYSEMLTAAQDLVLSNLGEGPTPDRASVACKVALWGAGAVFERYIAFLEIVDGVEDWEEVTSREIDMLSDCFGGLVVETRRHLGYGDARLSDAAQSALGLTFLEQSLHGRDAK